MAFSFGNKTVTDGLVLYLDAANPVSYNTGNTTWNNLVKSNAGNGTLTNGPVFDSGNQGSISFDGVDDYIIKSGSANLNVGLSGSVTIEAFINHTQPLAADVGTIFQFGTGASDLSINYGIGIYQNNTSILLGTSSGLSSSTIGSPNSVLPNTWWGITVTYSSTGGGSYYLNGSLQSSHTYSTYTTTGTIWSAGNFIHPSFSGITRPLTGKIASIKIYNKVLSSSEVLQNYKATKSRFGL